MASFAEGLLGGLGDITNAMGNLVEAGETLERRKRNRAMFPIQQELAQQRVAQGRANLEEGEYRISQRPIKEEQARTNLDVTQTALGQQRKNILHKDIDRLKLKQAELFKIDRYGNQGAIDRIGQEIKGLEGGQKRLGSKPTTYREGVEQRTQTINSSIKDLEALHNIMEGGKQWSEEENLQAQDAFFGLQKHVLGGPAVLWANGRKSEARAAAKRNIGPNYDLKIEDDGQIILTSNESGDTTTLPADMFLGTADRFKDVIPKEDGTFEDLVEGLNFDEGGVPVKSWWDRAIGTKWGKIDLMEKGLEIGADGNVYKRGVEGPEALYWKKGDPHPKFADFQSQGASVLNAPARRELAKEQRKAQADYTKQMNQGVIEGDLVTVPMKDGSVGYRPKKSVFGEIQTEVGPEVASIFEEIISKNHRKNFISETTVEKLDDKDKKTITRTKSIANYKDLTGDAYDRKMTNLKGQFQSILKRKMNTDSIKAMPKEKQMAEAKRQTVQKLREDFGVPGGAAKKAEVPPKDKVAKAPEDRYSGVTGNTIAEINKQKNEKDDMLRHPKRWLRTAGAAVNALKDENAAEVLRQLNEPNTIVEQYSNKTVRGRDVWKKHWKSGAALRALKQAGAWKFTTKEQAAINIIMSDSFTKQQVSDELITGLANLIESRGTFGDNYLGGLLSPRLFNVGIGIDPSPKLEKITRAALKRLLSDYTGKIEPKLLMGGRSK